MFTGRSQPQNLHALLHELLVALTCQPPVTCWASSAGRELRGPTFPPLAVILLHSADKAEQRLHPLAPRELQSSTGSGRRARSRREVSTGPGGRAAGVLGTVVGAPALSRDWETPAGCSYLSSCTFDPRDTPEPQACPKAAETSPASPHLVSQWLLPHFSSTLWFCKCRNLGTRLLPRPQLSGEGA